MNILISGASTGIGKACAVHLAQKNHQVWAGVRNQKDFDEMANHKLKNLIPVFLDVTNDDSVQTCVKQVLQSSPTLDALINNAGIAVGGPIEAISLEDWQMQMDINFFGVIRLTQACLPALRESKGRIVNMSSISGRIALPFMGPYSASKFALEAFSDSLRRELYSHGVKVAVVEPGPIATPIWEKSLNNNAETQLPKKIIDIYGGKIVQHKKRIEHAANTAVPVSYVTKAVEHALTARRPRIRYPVGRGAKTTTFISQFTPDRWLDRLMQ